MSDTTGWHQHAACRNHPWETFFPTPNDKSTLDAIRICMTCPVINQCLEDALDSEQGAQYIYGIRGGLTPTKRRTMLRAKARTVRAATLR